MKIRGFALREYLSITAFITFVIFCFAPAYQAENSSQHKLKSRQNLSEIGRSVALYCADYDQTYAYGVDRLHRVAGQSSLEEVVESHWSTAGNLEDLLYTYTGTYDVFEAPGVSNDFTQKYPTTYTSQHILFVGAMNTADTRSVEVPCPIYFELHWFYGGTDPSSGQIHVLNDDLTVEFNNRQVLNAKTQECGYRFEAIYLTRNDPPQR